MTTAPASERVYRQLLRLLPVDFRARFGADLLEVFRDSHRAASSRGILHLVPFWVRIVRDVVASAILERIPRDAAPARPRRSSSEHGRSPEPRVPSPDPSTSLRVGLSLSKAESRAAPSARERCERASARPRRSLGGGGAKGVAMDTLLQDVRYAWRVVMRRPAVSIVIVVTLALGIGANTAIFSLVNTVLLRPLPYRDPGRLFMVWEQNLSRGDLMMPVRPANFFDWKARSVSFEDVAWSRDAMYNVTGDGPPESVIAYRFSANMLPLLGVQPALGRGFAPEEDQPGRDHVVLLSHKLWQRRYAGDPGVLGRSMTLNGESYTIIGVMPASFNHPQSTELWTPIALTPALAARRDAVILRLVARLKPGVSPEEARRELTSIYEDLARRYPDVNIGLTPYLVRLGDAGDAKAMLAILFGGVGFVLLIACANVANLLLADATARRRELAVRGALGATRSRVVRQMLTESVMLALAGGLLGGVVTWWMSDALVALFPRNISNLDLPLVDRIDTGAPVFLFALVVSLGTGVLFGLLPAWNAARADLQGALKEGDRGGSATSRTQSILVVAEVALSIVLLAGALLMVQSFRHLQRQRLGFEADRVLSGRLILPRYRYGDRARVETFTRTLLERLRAIPGVESAGVTNYLPLSGWWGDVTFYIDGQAEPAAGAQPSADFRIATDDYFRSMGIQLLKGRAFTVRDDGSAPRVVIVNETLAKHYWPGTDPVGKRIFLDGRNGREPYEIVGLIADVKSFGLEEETHGELFFSFWQQPSSLLGITLRAQVEPSTLAGSLREAVWSIDRDQPITHLLPMAELARESLAFRRVGMLLAGGFGALALALAAIGIYGVLSYSVSRRTREIGVRMALGATRGEVARLVVREGLAITAIGIAIGVCTALLLMRFLTSVLFEVRPGDPATYATVAVTLAVVALLATWRPAQRATAVDPIVALRAE
jgi:putative ABC transport system permease protein